MNITPLIDLEYNATNIPADTTPTWSATASYAIDTTRKVGNKLFRSLAYIPPLCEYIHDNSDILNAHKTTIVLTGLEVADNTAVTCELDVTVVFNKDDSKYYIFDNATGTVSLGGGFYSVNFATQDPTTPPNFTEVTDHRHEVYEPTATPLKWFDLGYTNKYKCLDQELSSQTVYAGDITMQFLVKKIDEIYVLNFYASEITVTVTDTDSATVIYDETISTVFKNGGTFYNYFFNDFTYKNKLSSLVPISLNAQVDITIKAIDGMCKVGLVGMGRGNYAGGTLYGANIGLIDFSKKLTNTETGENYIEEGNYKTTNSLNVDIPNSITDQVYDLLVKYRAVPVVFRNDGFDSLVVYGIYKNFNILVSLPTITKMSIEVESLI